MLYKAVIIRQPFDIERLNSVYTAVTLICNRVGVCLYKAVRIRRPFDNVRLKSVGTTATLNSTAYHVYE